MGNTAYSKKHNETVKSIFESTVDHPGLLVKMMEAIGGARETLKWTKENGYFELEEKLVQAMFDSDLDTATKIFLSAETENMAKFEKMLKSIQGGTKTLNDVLNVTKGEIKTLLNRSKGKTTIALLNWIEENCKTESDSTLRDVVLESDSKKILEIEFLDWVKGHVECKWPGTLKQFLVKRCFSEGALIGALASDSAVKSPAMEFLNWVKANFEEALSDAVLMIDRHDYDIFGMVILNFHIYFSSAEFLLDLLKDHPNILRTMLLSQSNYAIFNSLDNSVKHSTENSCEVKRTGDRLKEQYRIIGQSLLKSETNINEFHTEELEVLANNFEYDDQQMENKQEILNKIYATLKERENARRNFF